MSVCAENHTPQRTLLRPIMPFPTHKKPLKEMSGRSKEPSQKAQNWECNWVEIRRFCGFFEILRGLDSKETPKNFKKNQENKSEGPKVQKIGAQTSKFV